MKVEKNIQFTLVVKLAGRMREVNFRRRTETLFDVDVADERGVRWYFQWSGSSGEWALVPVSTDAPVWMLHNESTLREAFLTEMI